MGHNLAKATASRQPWQEHASRLPYGAVVPWTLMSCARFTATRVREEMTYL
jgi:hypothetical protein